MARSPRDLTLDSTLSLLRQGYRFAPNRLRKRRSPAIITRLMFRKAIITGGPDAASMFYHLDRFTRNGALPPHTVRLLRDLDSVQMQQEDAHRHRKAMFLHTYDEARSLR